MVYVPSPSTDLFCCGHAFIGDGRLLTAGGTITFPPDSVGIHNHLHFEGHRRSFSYNPMAPALVEMASMNFEPGSMNQGAGRWYPTLCTLSTGTVLPMTAHPPAHHTHPTPTYP